MRESLALLRATWLTESSYRLGMLMSLGSLAFVAVPLYFVSNALQPVMARSIASQSREYFAFTLVGAMAFTLDSGSISALPNQLSSSISRGTLEAFLATPTSPAVLFTGMSLYAVAWAVVRSAVLLGVGLALGVHVAWRNVAVILVVLALLMIAYAALGLFASAMILCFRTVGPFIGGILAISALLGGVYYPTHIIPSWLHSVSAALPITYGLRALRQATLLGASLDGVGRDVAILAAFAAGLLVTGGLVVAAALRYARTVGTLSQY